MEKQLTIKVFEETLVVCRLDKSAQVPDWTEGNFLTITRTPDELSIVCCQENIPEDVKCERGWRYFKIDDVLDFSLVGILASLMEYWQVTVSVYLRYQHMTLIIY